LVDSFAAVRRLKLDYWKGFVARGGYGGGTGAARVRVARS